MSRVRYTEVFQVDRPVAEVFPLFSAEGETLWVPGWEYENVMGGTDLHENYVFLTRAHDHATADAIWVVKRYEPKDYHVEFFRVEPGDKVGVVVVRCHDRDGVATGVEVTYEYIGISAKGDEFIDGFTAEDYRDFIGEWKTLLDDHFQRVDP